MTLEEQIIPLLDVGLLFNESPKGNSSAVDFEQIIFPDEIRRTLQAYFLIPYRSLQPLSGCDPDECSSRHPGLEAIFHLLCVFLHHRAVQTQKGTLHRKSIERWAVRLGIPEPRTDFFQFALEFCTQRELFTLQRNHYRPSPRLVEWLAQDEKVLRNELWTYFLQTRLLPDRTLQLLPMIFRTAEGWVERNHQSPIFSIADLVSFFPKEGDRARIVDALGWLAFLGLLRMNDPELPTSFSLTRDGVEVLCHCTLPEGEPILADPCVLQPNFDLLVPPVVGYPVLWKLEYLAEFKRRDVFTEYHLSQHSVLFGMRRGWTWEEVMAFITDLTDNKFSGNVQYSLEEWCKKYGQITMRRIVLVECASSELAEEVSHVPEMRELLEQRISDRCFAVAESNARVVLHILRERGYEPSAAKRLTDDE